MQVIFSLRLEVINLLTAIAIQKARMHSGLGQRVEIVVKQTIKICSRIMPLAKVALRINLIPKVKKFRYLCQLRLNYQSTQMHARRRTKPRV